jgi:DNA helicase IV
MELDGDCIRVTRRGQVARMSLQALTSAPALRKGMVGTALTINAQEHNAVTLKGAGHFAAAGFAEDVKNAWTRFNLAALEKEAAQLDRVLARVLELAAPPRYPAACQIAPLRDDARELDTSILSKLNAEAIGPEVVARIAPVRKFAADPRTARAHAISAFVTSELDRWKDFFDTIESKPLTPEQELCRNLGDGMI